MTPRTEQGPPVATPCLSWCTIDHAGYWPSDDPHTADLDGGGAWLSSYRDDPDGKVEIHVDAKWISVDKAEQLGRHLLTLVALARA
jgi:hypothetical protein